MTNRFTPGYCYTEGGELMSAAIRDEESGLIFPFSGALEHAEEIAELMNQGMPVNLYPGVALTFRTIEESLP